MSLSHLTRSTLLRSSTRSLAFNPLRSLPITFPRSSSSSSSPSRSFASSAPPPSTSIPSPPPPNTPLPPNTPTEAEKHANAQLFSPEGTQSYRELLLFFSETLTNAFNTPYTPPSTHQFTNTFAYQEALKRPGMKIMEDPGTFVMVERIREAGQAEGMEMEAINQHILSILDSIAPPAEEQIFSEEQRKTEAEGELKAAVEQLRGIKDDNAAFLSATSPWKVNTYLPFGLGDKLNSRALFKRNNNDARVSRLVSRIMDCGYEAGRDPKEMSLLLKHGYFPSSQPPTDLTPAQIEKAEAEWDDGSDRKTEVEVRGKPGGRRVDLASGKGFDGR